MVLTGMGTISIDYSRTVSTGAKNCVLVPIPKEYLNILCASSAVGTGVSGRNTFSHMQKIYLQLDGPGTQGGTSSILVLRSSSSSCSSSSSSSSLSSSSSSLST